MYGGQKQGLKAERRDRVDGGLNTHAGPFNVGESQSIALRNFAFGEEGSLTQRAFAQLLLQTEWAGDGLLPAPICTALVGGGTIPAANYDIKYFMSVSPGGVSDYTSASAAQLALAVGANGRIQIDIAPNNLGEQVGQLAAGADDPFNGGTPGPTLTFTPSTTYAVLVKKDTDPDFTLQSVTFAWDVTSRRQRAILSAYSIGSTVPNADGNFPLRFIVWHPGLQRLIGITVDKAIAFANNLASYTRFGIAVDLFNAAHYWSRIPTRMFSAFLDKIMVIGDNIGRPKRLHWTGNPATSNWRLLGARAPTAVPTVATAAGPGISGVYQYRLTFIYQDTLPDGTTLIIESNSVVSAQTANLVNQSVDVTIPGTFETGLFSRRVYRTRSNGTVFFLHSDRAAGTGNLTFNDTTPDGGLVTLTPPDDVDKIPNDVPPDRLAYILVHAQRMWGVVAEYIIDSATTKILDFIGTNVWRFTKAPGAGTSEAVNAWPSIFAIECGDSTPITGGVSARGSLYVFKANSIGVIDGISEDDFGYRELLSKVGAMRYSIIPIGSLIYFWEDARGALVFDGSSFQELGYEIKPTWDADKAAGGYPWAVWFNPEEHEIHWLITNLSIAPPALLDATATFVEYVFHLPNKAWTVYSASTTSQLLPSRCITSADRLVRSGDIGRQVYSQVYATMRGALALDGALVNTGASGIAESGTATVTVKMFFGDDWKMVKDLTAVSIHLMLATNSTLLVEMAVLSNQTFQTVTTLTGVATEPADRVDYIPIPDNLFTNLQDPAAGKMRQDRALLVRLTSNNIGSAFSTAIRSVAFHHVDVSDQRLSP